MRVVTRPDFDGVVCAVILHEAMNVDEPTLWLEPGDMQGNPSSIRRGDVIANLPYHEKCTLWFDHHYSNLPDHSFNGSFEIAPSAAGVVYRYCKGLLKIDLSELVHQTDRIDSADLTREEVDQPGSNPYLLVSMTVQNRDRADEPYWNRLVDLFRASSIGSVMNDHEVRNRCRRLLVQHDAYRELLHKHTVLKGHVTITDFRSLDRAPSGNRFLAYSLYPESSANMRIRYEGADRSRVVISVGHCIFNHKCRVNIGRLLSSFNGGGHPGAGACLVNAEQADETIQRLTDILLENRSNEPHA